MTQQLPINGSVGAKFFGIFSGSKSESSPSIAQSKVKSPNPKPGTQGRRELLEQIVDFLMDNDLAVSPANLLAALSAFSGSNSQLARRIYARQTEGGLIDQAWLDEQAAKKTSDEDREKKLDKLFARLEGSVSAFSATTKSAHLAAADYANDLQLYAGNAENAPTTDEMFSSFGELAKAMLERTRRVEEEMKRSEREAESLRKSLEHAKRDAEIDHLTGLPNRRAFEGLLETHYREAQRAIEPLCVAFCDIDHFKRVNDTHGHETGDRVIQAIGQVLARITNETVHVARHGGEEFVMLFRGLNKREALEQLDLARQTMAERRFVNRTTDEPIGSITFSGGIADVFAYSNPSDALRAADEALYAAKEGGRNQIMLA
jgi:diguanylate cyclase